MLTNGNLLKRFKNTNYLFGEIIAEGLSDTGNTKITAECNDNFAVSNIKITQKDERSNHDYKISIVDAEFGEERYRWKDNLLEIFAKHKTCNSVFENKSEIQSLGSGKKIHTKLFFAELFSHAIAWKYMDTFIDKRSEELVSLMEGEIVGTFEKYNMIQRKFHNDVSKLMFEDEDGFLSLAS